LAPLFALWWTAAVLHALSAPGVSITWGAKPAWIGGDLIAWAGSPAALAGLGAAAIAGGVLTWHGATALLARTEPGICDACGYNLAGLGSDVCPECGAAAPPRPTSLRRQ